MQHADAIRDLLLRARARWRTLTIFHAIVRASLASAAVVVVALIAAQSIGRVPLALGVIGVLALLAGLAAALWGLAPLGRMPSDVRVARFVEERVPALDDRFV